MMILSYNPLGDNLAWVWELMALLITFSVIQALVLVNGVFQKRELLPTYITRKIIHIFAALLYLLCWMLYSGNTTSRYFAMVIPLAFIVWFAAIGLGLRKDEPIVNSMSRSGDPRELLGGTMHYAIVMLLATLLFFETAIPGTAVNPAALLIIGALAGGDGLAEIIGRRYGGERKFGIGGSEKTIAGTIAMFVGAAVMTLALLAAFSISTALVLSSTIGLVVFSSLLATIAEALSPKGIDNYVISIAVFIGIIIIYLVIPDMWPYPTLFTL